MGRVVITTAGPWKAYDLVGKLAFPEAEISDLRRRCGMPARDGAAVSAYRDAVETVLLTSSHYAAPADDRPPVTVAGVSIWDGPIDAEVPAELDASIDDGAMSPTASTPSSQMTRPGQLSNYRSRSPTKTGPES